jgi:hypothetical protein
MFCPSRKWIREQGVADHRATPRRLSAVVRVVRAVKVEAQVAVGRKKPEPARVTEEERAAVQALERTAVHAVVEALYTIPALHAANPKNLAHSFHPPAGPVISP